MRKLVEYDLEVQHLEGSGDGLADKSWGDSEDASDF